MYLRQTLDQCFLQPYLRRQEGLLIKERLEDNHLVAWLNISHKRTQHALIGARGDCDFGVWIYISAPEGRVRVGNGFLQARASLKHSQHTACLVMLRVERTFVGEY